MRLPVSSTYFRKIILFDPEYLSILGTRESLAMLQTTFVNTICSALNYRRPGLILSCLLFLSSVCLKGQSAQEFSIGTWIQYPMVTFPNGVKSKRCIQSVIPHLVLCILILCHRKETQEAIN